MKKMHKLLALLIILVIAITGCAKAQEPAQTPDETQSYATSYPLMYTDGYDRQVTISAQPSKVVSVSPSVTEMMYELGAQDMLAGRTDYCDFPQEVSSIESIGAINEPNVERIVELAPDLVIASSIITKEAVDKLQNAGINVVVLKPEDSINGVYDFIGQMGLLLDKQEKAATIVDGMKDRMDAVASKVKDVTPKTLYYVVGFGEYGDFTAGNGTFVNEILTFANIDNIAKDVDGWSYSFEKIVEHNPEYILLSKNYNTKDLFSTADGYKDLEAVKNGKILEIDENIMSRTTSRVVDAVEQIAKMLYPERF